MNLKSALRWAVIYRAVAWGVGGLLALPLLAAGVYFGARTGFPVTPGQVRTMVTTGTFAGFAIAALLVQQFVSSVAFYKTVSEATDEQLAARLDTEKVKSEVLSVLDDRLAEMQTELERTRKQVDDLGGGPTTGTATAGTRGTTGATDTTSTGSNAGTGNATGNAGTGNAGTPGGRSNAGTAGSGSDTGTGTGGDSDTGGFDFES